jgi:hypothetical protein
MTVSFSSNFYRWGSSVECLKSLITNKQALKALAIDDENQIRLAMKDKGKLILSKEFWERVEGCCKLFSPIATTITLMEGDEPLLSSTLVLINSIQEKVKETSSVSPLLETEESAMMDIIAKRREFCLKPIHLAANLLDPRYVGKHLSESENVSFID